MGSDTSPLSYCRSDGRGLTPHGVLPLPVEPPPLGRPLPLSGRALNSVAFAGEAGYRALIPLPHRRVHAIADHGLRAVGRVAHQRVHVGTDLERLKQPVGDGPGIAPPRPADA